MVNEVEERIKGNWAEEIDGKLTFFGVIVRHEDLVFEHWNALSTQISYMDAYDKFLLREVNKKPLEQYSRDDFDLAMDRVGKYREEKEYAWNDAEKSLYRHLIRKVTKSAKKAGVCEDVLWGTIYKPRKGKENSKEMIRLKNRKSLTEREEKAVYDDLMSDPEQEGEKCGLALMFCLGLRDNEASAADFGDVKPMKKYPEQRILFVYETTGENTNERKAGGKSKNAVRVIPVPEEFVRFYEERRAFIVRLIRAGYVEGISPNCTERKLQKFIDTMPIACIGRRYTVGCGTIQLSMAARSLFQRVKMDERVFSALDENLRNPAYLADGFREKDATAYLLRRNFGTRLYHLGLTETEIQYVIGHEISERNEERAYFRNEDKLYPICKKMKKRFLVNKVEPVEYEVQEESTHIDNETRVKLRIPVNSDVKSVQVIVERRESWGETRIRAKNEKHLVPVKCRHRCNKCEYPDQVNVTEWVKERYSKLIEE